MRRAISDRITRSSAAVRLIGSRIARDLQSAHQHFPGMLFLVSHIPHRSRRAIASASKLPGCVILGLMFLLNSTSFDAGLIKPVRKHKRG
jgi:hypothetical protein